MAVVSSESTQFRVAVNLTQLNAFNQYILSRSAVMLATGALTLSISATIEHYHPDIDLIAPGLTPWLLYVAAVLIPISSIISLVCLLIDPGLHTLLIERMGDELLQGEKIYITLAGHARLKETRGKRLKLLDVAFVLMLIGISALILHTYELYLSTQHYMSTRDVYEWAHAMFILILLIISAFAITRFTGRFSSNSDIEA